MLPGLNGDGKKLASIASALAGEINGEAGRAERVMRASDGSIYLRLMWRHEVRSLAVARADRVPSYEEAQVVRAVVGVPEDCVGLIRQEWVISQNAGFRVPVKAMMFEWKALDVPAGHGA